MAPTPYRPMKPVRLTALLILATPIFGGLPLWSDEDPFPPTPFAENHFDRMIAQSPFSLPTIEEVTVQPGWADAFRISSILRIGDQLIVILNEQGKPDPITVRTRENRQGLRLVQLNESNDPRQVSAVIARNGQQATVRYHESILSAIPQSVAGSNPAIQPE